MPARRAKDETANAQPDGSAHLSQRLDRWLWFARVTKSRSLAASLISDGRVRVNKQRVTKPAQVVKIDDVITVTVHRQVRVLRMLGAGQRRGPAAEAQLLYADLTPPAAPIDGLEHETDRPAAGHAHGTAPSSLPQSALPEREPGSGRPTKRDRRSLDRLRRDGDFD